MLLPLSLLKNYLTLDLPLKTIVGHLTDLGIEVEKIENETPAFSGVIVGAIKEVEKHPAADKLAIASVFDGQKTYQVVCGAPNCRAGLKSAFAPLGAEIKEEDGKIFKIKKAKLRGVESEGMLCSAKELKLSDEDAGILELPETFQLGEKLENYL
ncbi:MAG: phenylalanine--tRNA ligase subunit beta, partial [Parachlamydiales bacterium]